MRQRAADDVETIYEGIQRLKRERERALDGEQSGISVEQAWLGTCGDSLLPAPQQHRRIEALGVTLSTVPFQQFTAEDDGA